MRGDLTVIGFSQNVPCRIAASATRYEIGEPLHLNATTISSGAASANVAVLLNADGIIIGTDAFRGVAQSRCLPWPSGTVVAHKGLGACPIPHLGRIRASATTSASIDTLSELIGVIEDVVLITYSASGASDGGELYTFADAAADTSSFTIVDGNVAKLELDCTIDGRAYRVGNTIS